MAVNKKFTTLQLNFAFTAIGKNQNLQHDINKNHQVHEEDKEKTEIDS